jgi:RNA polymerase sigma-70 factor (ECF subfamily)
VNELDDQPSVAAAAASEDPDVAAIARLGAGELDALEGLFERHGTMAYSIALRITGDSGTAEDVVQEAFLGAWRNASRYVEGRGSVKTWLLAIVHHRAIDAIRRRRATSPLPEADDLPPEQLIRPDVWPDVVADLDRDAIAVALAAIPPAQRESIELAYVGGLTQVEVAERLGLPLGTVKSRMRLGLLALRRELLPEEASRG